MTLGISLQIAFRALGANKLRTILTMLSMIIGVGAVIALLAIGRGVQAGVLAQIQSIGTNIIFVRPGTATQGGVQGGAGSANTLTADDAEALAEEVSQVVGVAPEASANAQISVNGVNANTRLLGTTPDYATVRNFAVAGGEFITQQQIDSKSTVAVLGASVAQRLFPDQDPVDQSIRATVQGRTVSLRVIGVLVAKGGSGFGNADDQIIVPLTTLQTKLSGAQTTRSGGPAVSSINVQVGSTAEMIAATQAIQSLLLDRHQVSTADFSLQSQEDIQASATQITGVLTALLGSIAGISLIVGGIGIMNIMLVSVTERTREIGLRKAVGAKRRDILTQFLVEAVAVSLGGGLIGVFFGVGLAKIAAFVPINGQAINPLVTFDAIALAFGVSALLGIFFGIYPASRASRLNPITALRYE